MPQEVLTNGPFTPTAGINDGKVRDRLDQVIDDCNGHEAYVEAIARLLNLRWLAMKDRYD